LQQRPEAIILLCSKADREKPIKEEPVMSITVAAWNNGDYHSSGAGYGLRIPKEDRDKAFLKSWSDVLLQLPSERGTKSVTVRLSGSFWRTCSELRSAAIGGWLIERGYATWGKRQPPTFRLQPLGGNRFKLFDV
jgi:hypothetical protein